MKYPARNISYMCTLIHGKEMQYFDDQVGVMVSTANFHFSEIAGLNAGLLFGTDHFLSKYAEQIAFTVHICVC